jgi:hypothetical protein
MLLVGLITDVLMDDTINKTNYENDNNIVYNTAETTEGNESLDGRSNIARDVSDPLGSVQPAPTQVRGDERSDMENNR